MGLHLSPLSTEIWVTQTYSSCHTHRVTNTHSMPQAAGHFPQKSELICSIEQASFCPRCSSGVYCIYAIIRQFWKKTCFFGVSGGVVTGAIAVYKKASQPPKHLQNARIMASGLELRVARGSCGLKPLAAARPSGPIQWARGDEALGARQLRAKSLRRRAPRALLQKMTHKDKACYGSRPPCRNVMVRPPVDMTHSYARNDSFICETWLIHIRHVTQIHVCDMMHTYVWHDSYSNVWRDPFIFTTWLMHVCELTRFHMCDVTHVDMCGRHWIFTCVTHIHMCHMNYFDMCDVTHSYVWHDSFICWHDSYSPNDETPCWQNSLTCVTWLSHMCDMTHAYVCDVTHWYVWEDSPMCVTWLIRMCDMTHPHVRHDSCLHVWLIQGGEDS